ncbi:MAG: 4-phosphopantetheinyl transferase [Proteobacteria bacterium]|nr:MAG: 4-phosphopantetheinyl transferase [Pseudomonadota bacterium]
MDPVDKLDRRGVDLWLLPADDAQLLEALPLVEAALLPHELPRHQRIVVARARREYALTRVLVRRLLSRYVPVGPERWRFGANDHGRPHVASPREARALDFNVSHTAGMIVCLVGRERILGVDVEAADRVRRVLDIAERFFSPSEARALRALPEAAQPDRFLAYWTLKEAYIKAQGKGLAIPLDHFSFHLDEGRDVRISFAPALEDDPHRWSFTRTRPSERHQLAVALWLDHRDELPPTIRTRDALPLLLESADSSPT